MEEQVDARVDTHAQGQVLEALGVDGVRVLHLPRLAGIGHLRVRAATQAAEGFQPQDQFLGDAAHGLCRVRRDLVSKAVHARHERSGGGASQIAETLDEHRAGTVPRRSDGRRQPGGTTSHDDDVYVAHDRDLSHGFRVRVHVWASFPESHDAVWHTRFRMPHQVACLTIRSDPRTMPGTGIC